jgi:DNA-binding beta-propeller fold protein YncE
LLLGLLAPVAAAFALSAAPALAATGNVYRSQFTRPETGGRLFFPGPLAFNGSSDVLVADLDHDVVDEFKPSGSGTPLVEFTGDGTSAESFYTEGIAVNASGDVFVTDGERNVVYEFEPDGKLLREITGGETKEGSFYPTGVAVNSTTGALYVADYEHGVVDEFEPAAFEASPTGPPIKEFSISEPGYVAVDASSKDLYVTSYAGVVNEFEPDGTQLAFNGSGTPQGSSFSPGAVAVAPSGEVYVVDTAHAVVDRFSATGAYESQFEGGATPQASFSYISGLAVNASDEVYVSDGPHHVVDLFSKPVPVPAVTTGPASEETPTRAILSGSIELTTGLGSATCEFRYGTTASYGSTAPCVPAGPFSSLTAVTAEISGLTPGTEYHYRLEGTSSNGTTPGEDKTFTTTIPAPPTVSIKPVTVFADHSATFGGGVDPNEVETAYHFEYSTDGVTWNSLGQESAGEGTSEVPVTQTVSNLAGSTTYHVRLVAESVGGSVTSGEETFTTLAAPPQIFGAGASDITAGEATLHATIYPEKQATTYRFEYGTTAAYGTVVPAGEGTVGASTPSQVSQALKGLAPNMTYHFRVVATNATGSPTTTPDQSFTTLAAGEGEGVAPGACPNEALRAESNLDPVTGAPDSMRLPDCRAYEQVTPRFKDAAVVVSITGFAFSGVESIATTGQSVSVGSPNVWGTPGGDPAGLGESGVLYGIARGASGWATASLTPEVSQLPFARNSFVSSGDPAVGIWATDTPAQSENVVDLSRREASGAFTEIGPLAPASATTGPPRGLYPFYGQYQPTTQRLNYSVGGSSADLSDLLFTISSPKYAGEPNFLWPGDGTLGGEGGFHSSLYEYVGSGHTGEGGDVPALIGVDNGGTQISQCGTNLGASNGYGIRGNRHNAVSAAGSTVFFGAQAGGCNAGAGAGPAANQLYARIGSPGATQTTVNVAGTSGCETSTSCNVTSPVTYQGASKDGSKVFFTTSQALLPGDKDTTSDIYECELPGDGGATPAHSGVLVNACPFLKAVSVTGTSAGANVQSVVAVSEEGSHVYFTATGVLTSTANSQGRSAEAGKDNLYVWEAPGAHDPTGHTAFIATLSEASPEIAQATPDGRYLVFTTTTDLTLDDTSTVAQAFRYDAQTGELSRISTGQNGFNDDGNTDLHPVTLAGRVETAGVLESGITISSDGSYVVFQSSDALTPGVHGGINNVYEWHNGSVYLISDGSDTNTNAGLVGMDASGANVFFRTADKLVGQDGDENVDVYDARIDGGFPAPTPAANCSGESCQGPLSSSLAPPLLGSTGAPAIGNLGPPLVTKPVTPKPKPKLLTRAQKLTKALKQCKKDKKLQKRRSCEKEARKKYGPKAKSKSKK